MSPTDDKSTRFIRDYNGMPLAARRRFLVSLAAFVADLRAQRGFRPGLRVKRVQGQDGVWEMTFAPDGRATFEYGPEVHPGEPHVIWRRVGTHDVLDLPYGRGADPTVEPVDTERIADGRALDSDPASPRETGQRS